MTKPFIIFLLTIFVAALLGARCAEARDLYGIVGGGMAEHPMEQGDGHWVQDTFDNHFDLNSPTFTLGIGYKVKPWLAVEADYRDLGGMNGVIRYVSDHAYQSCKCANGEDVRTGYMETDVHGFGLSALFKHKTGVTLRTGLFMHHSDVAIITPNGDGLVRHLGDPKPFSERAMGYMIGIGYQYENLRVEYTHFPNVNAGGAPNLNINTFTVSLEF